MKPSPRQTLATPSNQDPHGSGSFAVGFLLGVVTGAIGLWTTQNEQGRQLLTHLKQEFAATLEAEKTQPQASAPAAATPKAGKKFPKFSASKNRRS